MPKDTTKKKTPAEYREGLPEELRDEFDRFVEDYKFAATQLHGQGFVSYGVLALLIRSGWRRSDPPIE